jgi:uncharacterized membrane protein
MKEDVEGKMKEELLKSVAQPMQVFFAPFRLSVANFTMSALAMVALLLFDYGTYIWTPIISAIVIHIILIIIGRREPHIDNILAARGMVYRRTKNIIKEGGNKYGA